jgi:hypothetical protein
MVRWTWSSPGAMDLADSNGRPPFRRQLPIFWSPRSSWVQPVRLGVEPATPSLPSMRGSFMTPCRTARSRTTAQVRGTVEGRVVGRDVAASSRVSGKSLARARLVARAGRCADSTVPLTEGDAGSESLPLDPAAGSRLTNGRATRHHGRHGRGRPETQVVSDQPVGLGDGSLCCALEQTATADPRPVSGSSSGLSRVSSAGSTSRGRRRAQRAAAGSADSSTRTSYAGRAAPAGAEPH